MHHDSVHRRASRRRSATVGLVLALALLAAVLVPPLASAQEAGPTNQMMMDILRNTVIDEPQVRFVGVGSWTGSSGRYKDPMAPGNLAKELESVSDHDIRMVVAEGTDDTTALRQWRAARERIRTAVRRRYGSLAPGTPGHRVLQSTNLYPPEQLVAGIENADEAVDFFRQANSFPNLGIDDAQALTPTQAAEAAEGIWGAGKAPYVQAYERQTGRLIYYHNGRALVNSVELQHFRETTALFTPEGSMNTAVQWLQKGRDAFFRNDAGKAVKHLRRALTDINKARALLRVGGGATSSELNVLLRHLERLPPAELEAVLSGSNRALAGRLERALVNAETESRLIQGYMRMSGPQRETVRHLLTDPHPRWTKFRNALTEINLKIPRERIAQVGGVVLKAAMVYMAYSMTAGIGAKAGEEGFLAAAKQAGIDVAMFANLPVGLLAMAVDGVLEDAKSFGFAVVSLTQDCTELLAGISSVKGSEGTIRASTDAATLARLFAKPKSVRDQVFYFADQTTQRDYGTDRGEVMKQADAGRRDALMARCSGPILQNWFNERLLIQDRYEAALLKVDTMLKTKPLVMAFSPDPAMLAPPGEDGRREPVSVAVEVRSLGDWRQVSDNMEIMRQTIDVLGGKDAAGETYLYERVKCYWMLQRVTDNEMVPVREEEGRCFIDDATHEWEISLSEPGSYLVRFEWRFQMSTHCPYCPVQSDLDRFHAMKAAGEIDVLSDDGLRLTVAARAAGEEEARILFRRTVGLANEPGGQP